MVGAKERYGNMTTSPYLITLMGAAMFRWNVCFFFLFSKELYGGMHTFYSAGVVIAFHFFAVFFPLPENINFLVCFPTFLLVGCIRV